MHDIKDATLLVESGDPPELQLGMDTNHKSMVWFGLWFAGEPWTELQLHELSQPPYEPSRIREVRAKTAELWGKSALTSSAV